MRTFSVWHWIIFLSVVLIPMAAYLWSRPRAQSTGYHPLHAISPLLHFFVAVAFIGRPILAHLKNYPLLSDSIPRLLLVPLLLFLLVSVYVSVGLGAYFFYRAMRNINFFAQAQLLAPSSAWLMVVPVVNIVAIPYVWGRAYYYSRALQPHHRISKHAGAIMSVGTFALLLIELALSTMADNMATWPPGYDSLSLSFIGVCTSTAGSLLFARIVQRISAAQELFAESLGLLPSRREKGDELLLTRLVDGLRSATIISCLGLALLAAAVPAASSSALRQLSSVARKLSGVDEKAPALTQALLTAADEVNKNVPQQIDQITLLDRARVEGDQFVYEYTLSVAKLSGESITRLYRHVRVNAVPAFCTGPLKDFRRLKAVLVYRYRYSNGDLIGQVAVKEQDCR